MNSVIDADCALCGAHLKIVEEGRSLDHEEVLALVSDRGWITLPERGQRSHPVDVCPACVEEIRRAPAAERWGVWVHDAHDPKCSGWWSTYFHRETFATKELAEAYAGQCRASARPGVTYEARRIEGGGEPR